MNIILKSYSLKLYYHKTDGEAEYLCSEAIEGTNEGDLRSPYVIRLDGEPELLIKEVL